MKGILLVVLSLVGWQNVFSQIIVDRNKQVPIEINAFFFISDYQLVNLENTKYSFSDLGLGKGQIFTYKNESLDNQDFQSLVLINAYVYSETSKTYVEYKEFNLAIPNKTYSFKLLLACMSKVANSPVGKLMDSNNIITSSLARERAEIDNFKLKYRKEINEFLNKNLFIQNNAPKVIISETDWEIGPKPTIN